MLGFYFNTQTQKLSYNLLGSILEQPIPIKVGNELPIRVIFSKNLSPRALTAPVTITLGVKTAVSEEEFVAVCETWTYDAASKSYNGVLDLNTVELIAAIGTDDEINCVVDVRYSDANVGPVSSDTVNFVVERGVVTGDEGTPTHVPTPDEWLSQRAVRFDEAQTLTSGEALQARDNIQLGDSATRDVGTTAGTVAAGDDPRFSDVPAASLAATIHAATSKTTPVDADELPLSDSAASWGLKKLTWANIKATLAGLFASRANNLSDLASASTARTNLGLGTAATYAASSSGTPNTVALRDAEGSAAFASGGAFAAVQGINSSTGSGLYGDATSGKGVEAISGSGTAIYGYSFAGDLMQLEGNAGVVVTANQDGDVTATSFSGDGSGLTGLVSAQITDATKQPTPDTLVLRGTNGEAIFGDIDTGFFGEGLYSSSGSGVGVVGISDSGTGAVGTSDSGIGVRASTESGLALELYSGGGDILKASNAGTPDVLVIDTTGGITSLGDIVGQNLSGTNTGDQTTVTGNAGTATALQTARTIGGTSFDGTTNIEIPRARATSSAGGTLENQSSVTCFSWGAGGGQNLTIPAGTGVGLNATSYTFGTGAAAAFNSALGGLAAVTPGTGVATFLENPTSANFAAAVTGETGTAGGVVFSVSPTLTTPIARGAGTTTGTAFTVQNSASATRAIIRDDGNYGVNGYVPSSHVPTTGYSGVWMDSSNCGVIGETTANFRGINLNANATRSGGSWAQQDATRNSFILSLGYEASNNGLNLLRAAAGAGNTFSNLLSIDANGTATHTTLTSSAPSLIASGPTSSIDTIQIRGTNNSSYSSIGLMDASNTQRGSFGYGGSTAGSYASTVFFNSGSGIPMTFGTNASERMRLSVAGGLSIGTTTDAGATNLLVAGRIVSGGVVRLKGYTFATLPAGTQGDKAFITDGAALPIFRANAAGGGSTVTEVFFNGTAWINS